MVMSQGWGRGWVRQLGGCTQLGAVHGVITNSIGYLMNVAMGTWFINNFLQVAHLF